MLVATRSRLRRLAPSSGVLAWNATKKPLPCLWTEGSNEVQIVAHGALLQQVRYGPKDGRPGRLEHHRFGAMKGRGKFYYRFHKIIGKWNWRGYQERYIAPRALENRQRWIPTTHATHTQMRRSKDWYWRLPKALAVATTSNEVLEAWIRFRHKLPKRTYHYFKVLRRLIEVGGCDPTDWRLKFITSRLHVIHRKVLNIPRLLKYYAQLRVTSEMEHLTRFTYKMLPKYSPAQVALTAHAFGTARLQDKRLFAEIARILEPRLLEVSPTDLVRLAHAFAVTDVCHYTFLCQISAQAQVRVQQASEGTAPPGSCPTFLQLSELAEAFARLKLQDYSFFEMCSVQAEQLLTQGLPGPTPEALARLCTACARLKIHEVRLFEVVMAHVAAHWYDYPAAALAEIGSATAPTLPRGPQQVHGTYEKMMHLICADRDLLTLRSMGFAVRFLGAVEGKKYKLPASHTLTLAKRLVELRDDTRERYDISRVIEVFARRCPDRTELFSTLCRHVHRHLGVFEPVDFVRFARGLSLVEYRDDRVAHALDKWARKRSAEFSPFDWDAFLTCMAELGDGGKRRSQQLRKSGLGRSLPLPPPTSLQDTSKTSVTTMAA